MFHNLLLRAPATEHKDTSNTRWILHRCQALQWHKQFLSIHLDEIIPANLHWSQEIYFQFKIHFLTLGDLLCSTMENASMLWLLEKITLYPSAFTEDMALDRRNGQDYHLNTHKLEQRESVGRSKGPLPQGSKYQPDKYAASITRGTKGS